MLFHQKWFCHLFLVVGFVILSRSVSLSKTGVSNKYESYHHTAHSLPRLLLTFISLSPRTKKIDPRWTERRSNGWGFSLLRSYWSSSCPTIILCDQGDKQKQKNSVWYNANLNKKSSKNPFWVKIDTWFIKFGQIENKTSIPLKEKTVVILNDICHFR